MDLFTSVSQECSKLVTNRYSTSFSLGIKMLGKEFQSPIYGIYGFVRFADEIVDTFHQYDKELLLKRFREDTAKAIEERISLNPILHSFQDVVHRYQIENELIDAFLDSMEMDLETKPYNRELLGKYIYGSAEVVGLMCLRVFTKGDRAMFDRLKGSACSLGAAFQKVNFLRDLQADYEERGRVYFPNLDISNFSNDCKKRIEEDIDLDFKDALTGISKLPDGTRYGVFVAYTYYFNLFAKIRKLPAARLQESRVRIGNFKKMYLLCSALVTVK